MDEGTERLLVLGVASAVALTFLASRFETLAGWREALGTMSIVLLGVGALALTLIFGIAKLVRWRSGDFLSWNVGEHAEDALLLRRDSEMVLLKGFEILSAPKSQEPEPWGSSKTIQPNTLEGVTRTGAEATIVTIVKHDDRGADANPSEPLLRTFMLVSHRCDEANANEVGVKLDAQIKALQSALMASTRGCKVTLLHKDELTALARRLLLLRGGGDPSGEGGCPVDVASSLHLIDGRVGDIVDGSTLPTSHDRDGLNLGRVLFAGSMGEALNVPISSISKHTVVFGATGSGKSNTGKLLIKQLALAGIPVLVLDFHNEYSDIVKDVGGAVVELDGSMHLDVLQPFPISDFSDHISIVTDAFNNVFHFTASQYFMFRETLAQALTSSKLSESPAGLAHVVKAVEEYYPNSFYENETKFALLRRLKPLVEGEARRAFTSGDAISMESLTSSTCDLRLGDIRDADLRNLFSMIALALLYEYRLVRGMSNLRHVTLVEESQNIVPYRDRTQEPSLFEKMFFEMRKYGESLILIAQFPSQIFPDIVKSAGVKIVHRMTETGDSSVAMDLMGLNRRLYSHLKRLPPGRALVLTDLNDEPLTVHFPMFAPSSDSELADLTTSTISAAL